MVLSCWSDVEDSYDNPKGEYHTVKLGRDIDCSECLQYCVPKGTILLLL